MRTTASNPSKGSTLRVSKTPSPTSASQRMTPPVRPVIDILPFEGAPVLVASIPELVPKQKPCYVSASGCYGGSYVRVGDGDRKLSGYEIDRLISEHAQPRFDDAIVGEATRDDLDAALVAGLLERERSMHPRNLGALSDETVLPASTSSKPTTAELCDRPWPAWWRSARHPQEFFPRLAVSFTCYPGVTKTEALPDGRRVVDSFTCTGPIPAMVETPWPPSLETCAWAVGSRGRFATTFPTTRPLPCAKPSRTPSCTAIIRPMRKAARSTSICMPTAWKSSTPGVCSEPSRSTT